MSVEGHARPVQLGAVGAKALQKADVQLKFKTCMFEIYSGWHFCFICWSWPQWGEKTACPPWCSFVLGNLVGPRQLGMALVCRTFRGPGSMSCGVRDALRSRTFPLHYWLATARCDSCECEECAATPHFL